MTTGRGRSLQPPGEETATVRRSPRPLGDADPSCTLSSNRSWSPHLQATPRRVCALVPKASPKLIRPTPSAAFGAPRAASVLVGQGLGCGPTTHQARTKMFLGPHGPNPTSSSCLLVPPNPPNFLSIHEQLRAPPQNHRELGLRSPLYDITPVTQSFWSALLPCKPEELTTSPQPK